MTPHLVRSYKPASAVLVVAISLAQFNTGVNAAWAQNSHHQSMAGGSHHGHGHGKQTGQVIVNGTGAGTNTSQQGVQSDNDNDSPSELELGTQTNSQKTTPNGFPASNEKTADHIEDEIKRQRALDVNYRHAIAKDLIKNWQPKVGGYVAYLVGLSKAGKVLRLEESASSGDTAAANKALKAIKFPPLPRGIEEITYSIDFKGVRTISIAQYSFTKSADEEKIPVNLNDAALEITERKPKPPTAADAGKNATGPNAAATSSATGVTGTTGSGGSQSQNLATPVTNNGQQDATQTAGGQTTASQPDASATASQPMAPSQPPPSQGALGLSAPVQPSSAALRPPLSQSSPEQTHSMQTGASPSGQPSSQIALSQAAGYQLAPPSLGSAQPITAPPPPPSAKQQGQPAPADLLQYQKLLESQIPSSIPSDQELSVWDLATTFGIRPNGKIKEQKITKTSGSQKVDASVMHAVHLAAPAVNLTDTDNAQFQMKVVFNGIVDGKVVKNAQPICTLELVNW